MESREWASLEGSRLTCGGCLRRLARAIHICRYHYYHRLQPQHVRHLSRLLIVTDTAIA